MTPSSVARNTLRSGKSLLDEYWPGKDAQDSFVSEELYIHSKLMIVDDRRVLIGSANINDRSQLGDRDSEIAIVIEDTEQVQSTMNGKPHLATRFAAGFRRRLFMQHMGMIPPQDCPGPKTSAMDPVGIPNDLEEQCIDPFDDKLWNTTARRNAEIYQEVFRCTPAFGIKNWKDYKEFVGSGRVGHARGDWRKLAEVRGHLVEMPQDFLENEDLLGLTAEVNPITLPSG